MLDTGINRNHEKFPTTVNIKSTSKHPLPTYAHVGDAGMDLRANINTPITLKPLERTIVPTGISIGLPKGLQAEVRPRSGLAAKNGITVLNSPGTIDNFYIGEIGVILINLSQEEFTINDGDRIAQLVIMPYETVVWNQVDELGNTERGDGAYGSSGIK